MSEPELNSVSTATKTSRVIVSAICIVMAIVFAVFAYLQINDATQYGNHDAWLWIVLYGAMALLSGSVVYTKIDNSFLMAWMGFCWGCLLFKIQDQHGNLQLDWLRIEAYWSPENEQMVQQVNESGGLFILASYATALVLINRYFLKARKMHVR